MVWTPADLVAIHSAMGPRNSMLEWRRGLYAALIELLSGSGRAEDPSVDVLDNPLVRAHVGDVLEGRASFEAENVTSSLEAVGPELGVGRSPLRVVSSAQARLRLTPLLERLGTVLTSRGYASGPVLVCPEGDGSSAEVDALRRGVLLLEELVPDFAADLLPHVRAIALVAAVGLGSASEREFPGLLVLPAPLDEWDVVEALVHEGAHQKFFDMSLTVGLLERGDARIAPSWLAGGATWPLQQGLAAFHAYCCLASLTTAIDTAYVWSEASLVPEAAARSAELGILLDEHDAAMTTDGVRFLRALQGRGTPSRSRPTPSPARVAPTEGRWTTVREFQDRSLIVVTRSDDDPVDAEIYWMDSSHEE